MKTRQQLELSECWTVLKQSCEVTGVYVGISLVIKNLFHEAKAKAFFLKANAKDMKFFKAKAT